MKPAAFHGERFQVETGDDVFGGHVAVSRFAVTWINGKLFQQENELKFEFYFNAGSDFDETIVRLVSINLAELGINMIFCDFSLL